MKYKVAENIKRLRTERGLTQSELATLLCVTSQAVSRWESAQSLPDIEMIGNIARYFSVSYDELLGGEETMVKRYRERYHELNHKALLDPSEQNTANKLDALEALAQHDDRYLGEYFKALMDARRKFGNVPDSRVEEARSMVKKGMCVSSLYQRMMLLDSVACAEDEDKLSLWKEEYEFGRIDFWEDCLLYRYSQSEDKGKFPVQRAKVLYKKVMRLICQVTAHAGYCQRDIKMILDTLNVYSTKIDDIFILERILYEFRYAQFLFGKHQDEEGFEMLGRVKAALDILVDLPEDALLYGSVPLLSPLALSYSKLKKNHWVFEELRFYDVGHFERVMDDARFPDFKYYLSRLLSPKRMFTQEDYASWAPLVQRAKELTEPLSEWGEAIVMESEKGNIYTIVYNSEDEAMNAEGALKLFAEMKEKGDIVVKHIVAMVRGGILEVPSTEFKKRLVDVDSRNLSALVLLNGHGDTYLVLDVKDLMPCWSLSEERFIKAKAINVRSVGGNKREKRKITDVVFDDITRNLLTDARKLEKDEKKHKLSENIHCFGYLLDIGSIDCDLYGEERRDSFNDLTGAYMSLNDCYKYRDEAEKIVSLARAGETLRVWGCNMAFALCALYRLCDLLRDIPCDIEIVEFPRSKIDREHNFGEGWGYVGVKDVLSYVDKTRKLSNEEKIENADKWLALKNENAPLRIYDGEKVVSVSEDRFDEDFLKIFKEAGCDKKQALGQFIRSFPVYVNIGFFTMRLDKLSGR